MNAYIYSIVCMAAACGIVCIIAPTGVRTGLKKHLKLVCAFCLLCVLVNPIVSFLDNLRETFEEYSLSWGGDNGELRDSYESLYDKYIDGGYGESIGKVAKEMLLERFGMPENECRITVQFDDENGDGAREPKKIVVILSGASVFRDPTPIREFLSESFECICECALEWKG